MMLSVLRQNWGNCVLIGSISLALVTVGGISAGVLGGKFDFKLPKKN